MKKKILSTLLSAAMLASSCAGLMPTAFAAANTPQYQAKERQMEKLNRGLIAVYRTANAQSVNQAGVYLSWRLLGDESLATQEFEIYKNNSYLASTTGAKGTNYIDASGTMNDTYKVVKKGATMMEIAKQPSVTPVANHVAASSSYSSLPNSFSYIDVPIQRPADIKNLDGDWSYYYNLDADHEGGANDASLGDLDGDGDYEIILKWDPTNSKDTVKSGTSGNVYIDAYEITTDTDNFKWRIDLGQSIRAGAHDTQILVYDFNGDGQSEVVTQTAAGSVDSTGRYVTEVGDTEEIRNTDNTNIQLSKGHNIGADFYTVFDGDTGEALYTTAGIPLGATNGSDWGDSKLMRAHRFLAAVAYLDGVHPSIVMCRGYYNRAVVRAYTWDGSEMTLQWEHIGASKGAESLYGQGNHNLSVADVDNDGKDEIVYGSAVLDDNGIAMGNTFLGHGDAMHVNDFNNDGIQEVFSVKEDSEGYKNNAANFRVAATGEIIFGEGASGDTGRGVMANIDDAYAAANPNALSLGWTSSHSNVFDLTGAQLKTKPANAGNGSFDNFLVYWDADLGRELLDANIIQKYDATNGYSTRFWGESDGYTLTGAYTNNYTKRTPCLVADLWGDWREEIIMAAGRGKDETPTLRIFTSTLPTDYRLTTLMHDSQYRLAIAWQNVGYNQPPHTSYYIGSAALATDESGNKLNYLAPATPYTKVTYKAPEKVDVTGVSLTSDAVTVEKGKSVTVNAMVQPDEATKKTVTWTTEDESIATVTRGVITGVSAGTTTVTATTNDGGFKASCEVTVFSNDVTGISIEEQVIDLGIDYSKKLSAYVYPSDASDASVTWSSDDSSIAKVSSDGTVTGVGYGVTTITATTNDGGFTDSCVVKVKPYEEKDVNSEDAFYLTEGSDDANITLTTTAASASLSHKDSAVGAVAEKKFTPYTANKATLKFRFTTGGQKYDGSNWNWTGHEYSMGLKFLDTEGNNILSIVQPYASSAGTLTSQIGSNAATGLINGWTTVIDGSGYVQGSAKRWNTTLEFDYDNDICNVTIIGTDDTWEAVNAKYTTSFSLNGQSFETMQLHVTKDGEGTIKAAPNIANLTYTTTTAASGTAQDLYQKDSWSEADIADWTQTGTDTATLAYDSEKGVIMYNPTQPATEYSASKTFEIADNSLVTYDADWYFSLSTGRDSVYEYIQFGSNLRLGWNSTYGVYVSTDAGTTYDATAIFTGANSTDYVKNVQVVFDTATNTVKSLKFDGTTVDAYTNYTMPEGTTFDTISFGLQRGGATSDWNYPTGVGAVKVSSFVYGEDPIVVSYADIKAVKGTDVTVAYAVAGMTDDEVPLTLIAAAYDEENDALIEVQFKNTSAPARGTEYTDTITFSNDLTNYMVKLFMWDSINGMVPLSE